MSDKLDIPGYENVVAHKSNITYETMTQQDKYCANCKHCDITIVEMPCCIFRCKLHPIFDKVCGYVGYKDCSEVVDNCNSFAPNWMTRLKTKIKQWRNKL